MPASGRAARLTVVVTGVGAPPGVSILKACRQSELGPRVVATDADPLAVGLYRADVGEVLPRVDVDEEAYLARLEALCLREGAAAVLFGSEVEALRAASHVARLERRTGARAVVNAPQLMAAFMDKWTTAVELRARGLPAPDTALASEPEAVRAFLREHPFPVVLKPRRGSGSKNMFVVRDPDELALLLQRVPAAVIQEYLLPDDEEYTVGLYTSPRWGYVGQIAFRRTLAAGVTYRAEVVRDPEIEETCREVVEALDLWGPVNLQLRKTPAGVRIFEINPRFSSSAVMRAHFGFNEPELCLRDLVLGERPPPPAIRPGWAFRYWDEVYLGAEDVARAGAVAGPRGVKHDDF